MQTLRTAVTFLSLIAYAPSATSRESDFYNGDTDQLQSLISEFAKDLCANTVVGERAKFTLICTGQKCVAKAETISSIVAGDVYLTNDYHFLFPQPSADVRVSSGPTKHKVIDGVNLEISKRSSDFAEDQKRIENLNDCYSGIGKTLAKKLYASGQSDFKEIAEKNGNLSSAKPRNIKLEFGQLTIAYAPTIDVRNDAIIAVEFVPSQRFAIISNQFSDGYFEGVLRKHESVVKRATFMSLPKPRSNRDDERTLLQALQPTESEASAPLGTVTERESTVSVNGLTGDVVEVTEGRADSLRAVESHLKSLSIQLLGDDAVIAALTPSRQPIRPLVPSTWLWKVRFGGKYEKSSLRFVINDPDLPADEGTVQVHAVDVIVNKPWDYRIQQFFSTYWQWILATFILPYVLHPLKSRLLSRSKKTHVPFKAKVGRNGRGPNRGKTEDQR
jgi:hypothetical protein